VIDRLSSLYIRYTPSQADVHVFKALSGPPDVAAVPHAARWYRHIQSYESEFGSLPGSSKAGEALTASAAPPAAAAEEDDDEVDLFGSDDEEDAEAERIKAERVAEYAAKKANKPKTIAKVRHFIVVCHLINFTRAPSLLSPLRLSRGMTRQI
jgi:elongation factor 1-beta